MAGLYFAAFHGELIIAETDIPAFIVTVYYVIKGQFLKFKEGKPVMLWT